MTAEPTKCAHPFCGCAAEAGSAYCGERCKDAAKMTEIACQCGHPACAAKKI